MGLILDSSVLITTERQEQNARQMLASIGRTAGNTDIAISVVVSRAVPVAEICNHLTYRVLLCPIAPSDLSVGI
jgi:hypothetical protein